MLDYHNNIIVDSHILATPIPGCLDKFQLKPGILGISAWDETFLTAFYGKPDFLWIFTWRCWWGISVTELKWDLFSPIWYIFHFYARVRARVCVWAKNNLGIWNIFHGPVARAIGDMSIWHDFHHQNSVCVIISIFLKSIQSHLS